MRTLAILATVLLSTSASAADLETNRPPAPPLRSAPVDSWTGFYVGINAGYSKASPTGNAGIAISTLVLVPTFSSPPKPSGFVFGGYGGYNYQSGPLLGGLEIDWDAANMKDQASGVSPSGNNVTRNVKVNDLASVRGRVGIVPWQTMLFYGTAGLAFAQTEADLSFITPGGVSASGTANTNFFGWVAGAGIEFKLMSNLLFRAEYLHFDFGNQTVIFPNSALFLGANLLVDSNTKLTADVARGGVGWKF
jgi:outer membrane immunogenic protein